MAYKNIGGRGGKPSKPKKQPKSEAEQLGKIANKLVNTLSDIARDRAKKDPNSYREVEKGAPAPGGIARAMRTVGPLFGMSSGIGDSRPSRSHRFGDTNTHLAWPSDDNDPIVSAYLQEGRMSEHLGGGRPGLPPLVSPYAFPEKEYWSEREGVHTDVDPSVGVDYRDPYRRGYVDIDLGEAMRRLGLR